MKKLIKMPSIEQFRNVIHNLTKASRYQGLDEDNEPIYSEVELPILKANGTVKLHGTNGSVCFNSGSGLWVQSKKNIIRIGKDNAGFAFFVGNNKDIFLDLINEIKINHKIDTTKNSIALYGEWAGEGIQKGVAISKLNKAFYIFGCKIAPFDTEIDSYWVESNVINLDNIDNIYHLQNFKTFEIDIDFNAPLLSNNKMVEMVKEVENECPVAKHFGVYGIGEGIVFNVFYKNKIYKWKMKGDKHAGKSKVKKAKKVDNKKLQIIIDVVEKVTPEWRLTQMYQETFDTINGGLGDIKQTGDYLRAVIKDVMKEENQVIADAGLILKDINATISKKARIWFMKKLDEESGL